MLRVAESDENFGNRLTTAVLWGSDSRRFALTYSLVRLGEEVSVFFRSGGAFREIKLPKLEAKLPKLDASKKKHLWHIAALNSARAVRWQKHGSLVVEIEQTIDGNSSFADATRTVVIGFNRSGAARILKSEQKVKVHIESKDPVVECGRSAKSCPVDASLAPPGTILRRTPVFKATLTTGPNDAH